MKKIYGNKQLLATLAGMRESGRTAHSLIFYGENGSGRKLMADHYAAQLMCEAPVGGEPCGTCAACRNVSNMSHPDVIYVPTEGKLEGYTVRIARDVIKDSIVKPNNATGRKVYIFRDCRKMSAITQNMLLKLIEEPPDHAYFIFTAESKYEFLPTIISRCVCFGVSPCTEEEAEQSLLGSGFKDSPMFSGRIHGKGPRYCPSIEDKINRFGDRDGHQLFLEPEQADIGRVYINGFSSSLPADIQLAAIHTIPGLTRARVLQIGYAVEYDSVDATQLYPTLECKNVPGLYFAGQVCGTSGYEEAAGQGLMAGINAALKVKNEPPFILGRSDSYLGVMLNDLVTTLLDEPYRMFTSRAEYRLFLRSDNAETRLKERAHQIGMLSDEDYADWQNRLKAMGEVRSFLETESATPEQANLVLAEGGQALANTRTRWINVLRRPGIDPERLFAVALPDRSISRRDQWFMYAEEIYAGFLDRQSREIEEQKKMESVRLPADLDFMHVSVISIESRQRLNAVKPMTLGQASRVPGVRPADITMLYHWLENRG